MTAANVTAIRPEAKPARKTAKQAAPRAPRKMSTRERLMVGAGVAVGGIAIAATALSLTDLADTVQAVTHCDAWRAWALSVALDANFIFTEAMSLFASAAIIRSAGRAMAATKVITLGMSAVANAYAMSHSADNTVMAVAGVAFGVAIPALIALATYTLGKAVRA